MKTEIRLKYSGLVIFLSKILSVFTGLLFSIILTHSLSKLEFGAWTNITGVLGTFGIASGVFPFWAARYTARRFEGAMKLGLLANALISLPAASVLILVAPSLASAASTSSEYYLFAAILVVQTYVIVALDSVVAVFKTHVVGYAFLSFEIIKLILVYLLLVFLRLGIIAALFAGFAANLCWISIYVVVLSDFWSQKINYRNIVYWIKGSPLIIYGVGASLLSGLEGYLLLFKAGSLALAYYGAAALVSGPIGYTVSLSAALYPKLLAGGTSKDAEAMFRMSMMFSVPLTVVTVALSSSLLAVLNADYVVASTILVLLSIRGLTSTFGSMFDAIISGTEKLDSSGSFTLRETISTRIFKSASIYYAAYPVYLPLLWLALQCYSNDPLGAARTTALAGLAIALAIVSLKYLLARRSLPLRFPLRSSLKFLVIAAILVSPAPFLTQPLNPLLTISLVTVGAGVYFLILYHVDEEAKVLIRSVWRYLAGIIVSFVLSSA